jgi:hypothetical protein
VKIEVNTFGEDPHKILEAKLGIANVTLSEVFSGISIKTEDGAEYGVALRDSGLEIVCPDGALVGVKRYEGSQRREHGETFVEFNCQFVNTDAFKKGCDNCRRPTMPHGTCHKCGRKWGGCA